MMRSSTQAPAAIAHVLGGREAPTVSGTVSFFPHPDGVLVVADFYGLPFQDAPCAHRIFGFHIHDGTACTGQDFADTDGHFDPEDCPHPQHAGDLPPLFGCRGRAYLAVLTDRFAIPDIIGHTVVVHAQPDDFTTQPAGNAGLKIACGVIRAL